MGLVSLGALGAESLPGRPGITTSEMTSAIPSHDGRSETAYGEGERGLGNVARMSLRMIHDSRPAPSMLTRPCCMLFPSSARAYVSTAAMDSGSRA